MRRDQEVNENKIDWDITRREMKAREGKTVGNFFARASSIDKLAKREWKCLNRLVFKIKSSVTGRY